MKWKLIKKDVCPKCEKGEMKNNKHLPNKYHSRVCTNQDCDFFMSAEKYAEIKYKK